MNTNVLILHQNFSSVNVRGIVEDTFLGAKIRRNTVSVEKRFEKRINTPVHLTILVLNKSRIRQILKKK